MLIFFIVVLLGLFTLLFRIFIVLIGALIQLVLYIIGAPIFILFSFTGWIKNIIGNLLVFPAVTVLLLVTAGINHKFSSGNSISPPFLGSINSDVIVPIINAAFLLLIPDLIKALKQKIIGKEGLQLPIGPQLFFAGAGGALGGGMGLLGQYGSLQLALPGLRGMVADSRLGGIPLIGPLLGGPGPQREK
jgi:hypothetical protein